MSEDEGTAKARSGAGAGDRASSATSSLGGAVAFGGAVGTHRAGTQGGDTPVMAVRAAAQRRAIAGILRRGTTHFFTEGCYN
jgi:hypothetical protein